MVARIVPGGQNGSSTYARIVSQEKTRKSPDLGRATSVQFYIVLHTDIRIRRGLDIGDIRSYVKDPECHAHHAHVLRGNSYFRLRILSGLGWSCALTERPQIFFSW